MAKEPKEERENSVGLSVSIKAATYVHLANEAKQNGTTANKEAAKRIEEKVAEELETAETEAKKK